METALQKVATCFKVNGHIDSIRLHGDIHPGNILWQDSGDYISSS
jgi:hypothetical protein